MTEHRKRSLGAFIVGSNTPYEMTSERRINLELMEGQAQGGWINSTAKAAVQLICLKHIELPKDPETQRLYGNLEVGELLEGLREGIEAMPYQMMLETKMKIAQGVSDYLGLSSEPRKTRAMKDLDLPSLIQTLQSFM